MNASTKEYATIGCCGIDCGLCPRYYTAGTSACPGCGGPNFKLKHPSCGFHTCCALRKGLEICSQCIEYPCKRFENGNISCDTFVTHKRIFPNHECVRANGVAGFIDQQRERIDLLVELLKYFDDGRSKSYFCLAAALLPICWVAKLKNELRRLTGIAELKERNRKIRGVIDQISENQNINLNLC